LDEGEEAMKEKYPFSVVKLIKKLEKRKEQMEKPVKVYEDGYIRKKKIKK